MAHAALIQTHWNETVEQLGGAGLLEAEARETKAFLRARGIKLAVDLLQFVLAYCLGKLGLRLTAAWADGIGLASISNVALLGRLRNAAPWLERIAARLMARQAEARDQAGMAAAKGRLVRIVDATNVAKADRSARERGGVWRIHALYELPSERLGAFEITDEKGAEAINRIAVVPGEIRMADCVHCRVEDLADVIEQGGDVLVRAHWRAARWVDACGSPFDLVGALKSDATGSIDRSIWLARGKAAPLRLRLVAVRMPKDKAMKAVVDARARSKDKGCKIQPETLVAAEWVILITSLTPDAFSTEEMLALYRLRWRIEIAFKRMKSLIGLRSPPGSCPLVAKAWVLAHLIAVLLTEAQLSAIGDSPRRELAIAPANGAPLAC